MSFIPIMNVLLFRILAVGRPQFYYTKKEFLLLPHRHKLYRTTRLTRGFLHTKKGENTVSPFTPFQYLCLFLYHSLYPYLYLYLYRLFSVFIKASITKQNRKSKWVILFSKEKSLLRRKRNRLFLYNGAGEVTRTPDLRITSALLYRLSYTSI